LSAYLDAFAKATKRANERYYIDAMAGCGECVIKDTGFVTPGSAWRALNARPRFTGIHLVELDRASSSYLRVQTASYSNVRVYNGDCNDVIPKQVLPNVSKTAPTLAFVDSTGVEPTWDLLNALSEHRRGTRGEKVELLILFAFDMFINIWMKSERLWPRLDKFFGSQAWREELHESTRLGEAIEARRARFVALYVKQLREELGYRFVDAHGPLMRGRHALYHMIFATDHPVAHKIMNDVWSRPRAIPGDMFYQREFEFKPGE
jgi:three-Cys-motif partner protein